MLNNSIVSGEQRLFIIDKWKSLNLSTYPIDISFSDININTLDYKFISSKENYETSIISLVDTELGKGYRLVSKNWNGIYDLSIDSKITNNSIKSIMVNIKSDRDLSKTKPQVKVGNVVKTNIEESNKWYSFSLSVEEWNKLCEFNSNDNTTYLLIQQQYWYEDNVNLNEMPFDIVITYIDIPYTVRSSAYETEVVSLKKFDDRYGYNVAVNQWNSIIDFTSDSIINDSGVNKVKISIKTSFDIANSKPDIRIGGNSKVTMTQKDTWYDISLTVEEFNKLCSYNNSDNTTFITIAQTNWAEGVPNLNNVSFDIIITVI